MAQPTPGIAVTNPTPDSCERSVVGARVCLHFADLWSSHPLNWTIPEGHPFRLKNMVGSEGNYYTMTPEQQAIERKTWRFENECSIKMSIALQGAGLSMKSYSGGRYTNYVRQLKKKVTAAGSAQELANWLEKVLGKPESFPGLFALSNVTGRSGIIFFKDFWPENPNSTINTGDHIDLWNGRRMSGSEVTRSFEAGTPDFATANAPYFEDSIEVRFWEIGDAPRYLDWLVIHGSDGCSTSRQQSFFI